MLKGEDEEEERVEDSCRGSREVREDSHLFVCLFVAVCQLLMGNNTSFGLTLSCIENFEMEQELEESTTIQLIWEYQRFQEGLGWGAGPHLLSEDPGRFSSYDRKIFGSTLQVKAFSFSLFLF